MSLDERLDAARRDLEDVRVEVPAPGDFIRSRTARRRRGIGVVVSACIVLGGGLVARSLTSTERTIDTVDDSTKRVPLDAQLLRLDDLPPGFIGGAAADEHAPDFGSTGGCEGPSSAALGSRVGASVEYILLPTSVSGEVRYVGQVLLASASSTSAAQAFDELDRVFSACSSYEEGTTRGSLMESPDFGTFGDESVAFVADLTVTSPAGEVTPAAAYIVVTRAGSTVSLLFDLVSGASSLDPAETQAIVERSTRRLE